VPRQRKQEGKRGRHRGVEDPEALRLCPPGLASQCQANPLPFLFFWAQIDVGFCLCLSYGHDRWHVVICLVNGGMTPTVSQEAVQVTRHSKKQQLHAISTWFYLHGSHAI
jgi:hypothetical protein